MIDKISFKKNPLYFEELYPNIWIMDNHKWAYYAWEKYFHENKSIPNTLVHLDFHWDAVSDFHQSDEKQDLSWFFKLSLEEIKKLIAKNTYIKLDSFIAPALIKKYFKKIHFNCFQYDEKIGFYHPILEEYQVSQFVHESINDLVSAIQPNTPIVFDFDIDIFNRSDQMYDKGDLWSEADIRSYLKSCEPLILNAKVITIAMSYGYSGDSDDTRYLTELVLSSIIDMKQKT